MASRNAYRLALFCFLLASLIRLAILFGTGLNHKQDHFEMVSVASAFASTGTIANPYMSMPTGPTAHVAPLYPILIGTVYRIFGQGETGENVRQILACLVAGLRSGLLVLVAVSLGLEGSALTAGLLGAIYIGAFDTELKGDWEGPLAGVLLLLLILWGCRLLRDRRTPSLLEGFAYGIASGVALLVAPALAPVLAGLLALAFLARYRDGLSRIAAPLLCCVAAVILTLAPWIARNYAVLGGFVWGRDNFGLELSISNGPGAHWSNPKNSLRIFSNHPSRYRPEAEKLAAMGELAYNADRRRQAVEWIRQNPAEFLRLTSLRAVHFWFPTGRNDLHTVVLAILTLIAFAGFALLRRAPGPAFSIVAVVWLTYPAMYYLIQWSSRYRLPIDWSLLLCAAVVLDTFRRLLLPAR